MRVIAKFHGSRISSSLIHVIPALLKKPVVIPPALCLIMIHLFQLGTESLVSGISYDHTSSQVSRRIYVLLRVMHNGVAPSLGIIIICIFVRGWRMGTGSSMGNIKPIEGNVYFLQTT